MGEDAPSTEAEDFSRVGRGVLTELLKRLENPDQAKELPATGLLQMANTYTKVEEKRLERDLDKDTGPEVDELDVILGSPLPSERKRELLGEVLVRLDERRHRIQELLEGDV